MWQYYVEFLDEFGGVVGTKVVTAGGKWTAIRAASREFTDEYYDVQATRL